MRINLQFKRNWSGSNIDRTALFAHEEKEEEGWAVYEEITKS